MTDDNDLVKRLRKRQEFEFIDGYKRIEWEDDDALEAADRIEALEDRLNTAAYLLTESMVQLREGKIKTRRNRADIIEQVLKEWRNE